MADRFPWSDHYKLAEDHGLLGKRLYVIFTSPTNGLGPIRENLEEHLTFQGELESAGIMLAAGPLADDNEEQWEGEGMVIIRADSLAAAREIAASDPMHKSGARRYRVRPWLWNEGGFNISVKLSAGAWQFV